MLCKQIPFINKILFIRHTQDLKHVSPTLGHIKITEGVFKNMCLIPKPYNRQMNNRISNGRSPSICSFKSSPGDSEVQPGLGITGAVKYCREVEGKFFVALKVVSQKSNRFYSHLLYSSARAEGLLGGKVFGCSRKTGRGNGFLCWWGGEGLNLKSWGKARFWRKGLIVKVSFGFWKTGSSFEG